jgi:hypothetical protein
MDMDDIATYHNDMQEELEDIPKKRKKLDI